MNIDEVIAEHVQKWFGVIKRRKISSAAIPENLHEWKAEKEMLPVGTR